MAKTIPDKPVSKPKRPKAGELLGNLEMRAALEPFIANDPLGKLGYELFRKGEINVDALVLPFEKYGQEVKALGSKSSVTQGTFQPLGEYRKAPKEALESQKSLDTSSKPSLWYSTGRDAKLRPGFDDMSTLSHELRHAAMNYLKNKGLYELPKEIDGRKFHTLDTEEALLSLQDIKRIKDKDYYTKDLDASRGRQPKEKFIPLLDSIYSEISDIAQKELTNLNVPKETKQKEKGWISKAKDFLGLDRGGIPMQKQMSLFQDGGLEQDGNTIDPESGNDVPVGSSQEEVRDDIPAQLSEGEFVFPADVVRYIGLEKLMMMRQEAKAGLARMEEMGQMGNSDEATLPDDLPFNVDDLELADDSIPVHRGGSIPSFATGGGTLNQYADDITVQQGQTIPPSDVGINPPVEKIIQNPPTNYQAPTVADTPVAAPTDPLPPFDVFVPPVADSYKEYINDEGLIINVPYFRGYILPGYTVPQGYRLKEDETVDTIADEALSDITQEPERDREREIQVAEEEKKMRDRSYDNVISQVMRDNPGSTLDEIIKKIKDGEATAFTNPLTGNIVKAPGFLFDEDNITSAYNRALLKDEDDYESGEGMEDTALRGTDAQEAINKAAEEDPWNIKRLKVATQTDIAKGKKEAADREAEMVANQERIAAEQAAKEAAQSDRQRIAAEAARDAREAERQAQRDKAQAEREARTDKQKVEVAKSKREGGQGYVRAKGGIIEKPKPKKKIMKRGGLASKKK